MKQLARSQNNAVRLAGILVDCKRKIHTKMQNEFITAGEVNSRDFMVDSVRDKRWHIQSRDLDGIFNLEAFITQVELC
jgi:hypothetical protein